MGSTTRVSRWDGSDHKFQNHKTEMHVPEPLLSFGLAVADLALVVGSFVSAEFIFHHLVVGKETQLIEAAATGSAIGAIVLTAQIGQQAYHSRIFFCARAHVLTFFKSWLVAFFIAGWIAFLTKSTGAFSRGTVTIGFLNGAMLLLPLKLWITEAVRWHAANSKLAIRRVAVIHALPDNSLGAVLNDLSAQGVAAPLVQKIDGSGTVSPAVLSSCRSALERHQIESVYMFVPWSNSDRIASLRRYLSVLPISVYLFADPALEEVVTAPPIEIGSRVAYQVQGVPLSLSASIQKRTFDLAVSLSALVLLMPLLIAIALAVYIDSGRPIFFRQYRTGFGGRTFQIFKFRTMRVCEDGSSVVQASRGDARVTPVGSFLRRTSMDELPQLLNVLRGEMSIVGPRPHALAHDEYYGGIIDSYAHRFRIKPGLTGWAQVNGLRGETRNPDQMARRVEYDLRYIAHWSLWRDCKIVVRTAWLILSDKHAY